MVSDTVITITLIILLLCVGLSLYNIYIFMPNYSKCEASFQVINLCRCMPDQNIAKLFNYNESFANFTLKP